MTAGKPKVIHVITRMILGGAQENTLLSVKGLQDGGMYDACLATGPALGPEGELLEEARRLGVRVVVLPWLRRELHPLRDAAVFWQLVSLFRREAPAIVHTHSAKAGVLGRLAARLAGVPVVVHTIHGMPFHAYERSWRNALYRFAEQTVDDSTTQYVSVCDAMTRQSLAAGIGSPERYQTIYSGMDTQAFLAPPDAQAVRRWKERLGIGEGDVVVAKIARLFELKGHDFLIDAAAPLCAEFPRLRFLFVGDGVWRERLQRKVAGLGLGGRFIFAGLAPAHDIPALLHCSNVLAHCSLREGLPRAVAQALLCAVPVIAFDMDGTPEVVRHHETGLLVSPGDTEGFRAALRYALGHLDSTMKAMALRGRDECARRFDAHIMVRQLEALYQHLLTTRSGVYFT